MNSAILSDRIEQFILDLLKQQSSDELLLKRKDVASHMDCAPSQVTYVINTRFSPDNRFIVESRRGSGGYIRIALRSVSHTPGLNEALQSARQAMPEVQNVDNKGKPNSIETFEKSLDGYFRMLVEYDIVTPREYRLICNMTHTMLEFCPEGHRREAVKAMIRRIEWVLKGE